MDEAHIHCYSEIITVVILDMQLKAKYKVANWSIIFQYCIFHRCYLVHHFLFLHFLLPHFSENKCSLLFWSLREILGDVMKDDIADDLE